jgi:hypothetical protein
LLVNLRLFHMVVLVELLLLWSKDKSDLAHDNYYIDDKEDMATSQNP